MSATRENILEQIKNTEEAIGLLKQNNQPTGELDKYLTQLREQLATTNTTLTEGTLLKG